jgi:hypothetical protein
LRRANSYMTVLQKPLVKKQNRAARLGGPVYTRFDPRP